MEALMLLFQIVGMTELLLMEAAQCFKNVDDEPLKVVPSKQNRKNFECTPR